MKIKHSASLLTAETNQSISRVDHLVRSSNGFKIAACLSLHNQVLLFDAESYKLKDKFSLKPADKSFSRKSFTAKGLAFSPDSTKLASGQTDCVIYVYKIGETWEEKKSIVARYPLQSSVTCLLWHSAGIIFGSADGKIKLIPNNSNRISSLISHNSMVISLAIFGDLVAGGYLNGSVCISSLSQRENNGSHLLTHTCSPFGLCLTSTGFLCLAGSDGKVVFTRVNGHSSDRQVVELGNQISGLYSFPSGNTIAVSSLNSIYIYNFSSQSWRQSQVVLLDGVPLITEIAISKDGSSFLVGTITGAIELFECEWKKKLLGNRFEVNYVGENQVIIKDVESNKSYPINSTCEIKDVKIVRNRFALLWTNKTLVISDINDSSKSSEIEWPTVSINNLKFCFDYENAVIISNVGELFIVELGTNTILASARTEFVSSHLISVRINERKSGAKVLAYLLDAKTIAVVDLISGIQISSWSNDDRVEWLELNETGKRLLYKDKHYRLHLLNIMSQDCCIILNYAQFVRWVPGSDVIVSQSKDKLYIWYNLAKPIVQDIGNEVQAEVIDIKRENGQTRVVFNNNMTEVALNEMLIEFDTALEDKDLRRAMNFLETCDLNTETDSMWRSLAQAALKQSDIAVSERAYAAVGDWTKADYIRQCLNEESKLSLLENDWATYESNNIEDVVETYVSIHQWEKAIETASRFARNDLREDLERRYLDHLIESNQEAEAGLLMERKGRYEEAIRWYIKSGRAIQAANLIIELSSAKNFKLNRGLVEDVVREMKNCRFFKEAGRLCEMPPISDLNQAYALYIEGKCFAQAIELARTEFPEEVVRLEEQFGNWLLNEGRDSSSAVNHFVEAGRIDRAVEAAIAANHFDKAAELVSVLDHVPTHLGRQLANYYKSLEKIDAALDIYINCGCIQDAISLLNETNQYQKGYKLARRFMDANEAKEMYENLAKNMEKEDKLKEAERIYITCDNVDGAIKMYKNRKQFDNMTRLVKQYHPDLINDTHLHLAKELENENQLQQAESHYVAAGEWKTAVRMYKNYERWEDAYRVARAYGGALAGKQVAFLWSKSLPDIDSSVKLLSRLGLLNQVVDYAMECTAYEWSLNLVNAASPELKHKINEVKLKYAHWLAEEQRYDEAEALFLETNKAKEAVIMYVRSKNFSDALRVAEQHLKSENVVSDILVTQARSLLEIGDKSTDALMKAESLLLRAGRIELAVKMYKDIGMWNEALRVCEQYSPSLISSVKRDMITSSGMSNHGSQADHLTMESRRSSSRVSLKSRQSDVSMNSEKKKDPKSELEAAEAVGDRNGVIRNALTLATQYIGEKMLDEAVRVVSSYQTSLSVPEARIVLIRLASDLMSFEGDSGNDAITWRQLRNALLEYININSNSLGHDEEQLQKFLLLTHYLYLQRVLGPLSNNQTVAKELLTKLNIALLRYTDVIRVDKCFYEAGKAAKESSKLDMAFVFWNHFLDLADAIEEGDVNVDHSDLIETDIPSEVPLPSKLYLADEQPNLIEDVRSWILKMSMDSNSTRRLPKDSTRGYVYEASLKNGNGGCDLPCLVTGYPVSTQKMLELRPNRYVANKDDWNKLLMLTKVR